MYKKKQNVKIKDKNGEIILQKAQT